MGAEQLLPLALSTITLWMMWQAGNLNRWAWLVGLLNQGLWLMFIIVFEAWGLLPLNMALVVTYSRNLAKWRREAIEPTRTMAENLENVSEA